MYARVHVRSRSLGQCHMPERSRARCMRRYGYRQFRTAASGTLAPLLWTFPGAGNTWMRMAIEFSTGVYSGSIYGDPSLLPLLPGEGRCDGSVIAVKAHPTHIDSFDIVAAAGGGMRLNTTRKPQYTKCAHLRFASAIAVIRDPYLSIWAEYKRYLNWKEVIAGRAPPSTSLACRAALHAQPLHSGGLLKGCFDTMHFRQHALRLARAWKHMWFHYGRFQAEHGASSLLQVSFEDLLRPTHRVEVLDKILRALGQPAGLTEDASSCAFALADHPATHRKRGTESQWLASVRDAYGNRTLVCQMWQGFRRRATKAGYQPFGGVKCDR